MTCSAIYTFKSERYELPTLRRVSEDKHDLGTNISLAS